MVTLGVALILLELANKLDWLTGGADGLQGVVMGPVLGMFEFDLFGRTAAYTRSSLLLVLFLLMRRLVHSPFGATLKAIRDNRLRAMAIGIPVASRLVAIYTIAAAHGRRRRRAARADHRLRLARRARFHRSADVMLMLVIGGPGWLYGGIAGAIVFKLLQDGSRRSRRSTGPSGSACSWWCWCWSDGKPAASPGPGSARARSGGHERHRPLRQGLVKRFGGITATDDVTLQPASAARAMR